MEFEKFDNFLCCWKSKEMKSKKFLVNFDPGVDFEFISTRQAYQWRANADHLDRTFRQSKWQHIGLQITEFFFSLGN